MTASSTRFDPSSSSKTEPTESAELAAILEAFERFIHRDPARRGLISTETDAMGHPQGTRLGAGQLAAAAHELALKARCVAIVTGFFIPHAQPPSAETDGPPGSLFLAHCLRELGIESIVITDSPCAGALAAAARGIDFPLDHLLVAPLQAESWCREFWNLPVTQELSHLIALERVGPSHTPESVARQLSLRETIADVSQPTTTSALDEFLTAVAAEHHDHCHNMRGHCIDAHTAPLHRLFELLPEFRPAARTIGVGDGGNEIGMGAIMWRELRRRLSGDHAGRVPCRVACDFNIVAGVSNWGGMALAAATCAIRNRQDILLPWTRERHQQWLEHLVENGPAVDGVTGRREATVDGLPFLTYIQPWEGIRRTLGWDE